MRRPAPWLAPADCLPCGRCCFSEDADYLPLFGADEDRLSKENAQFVATIDGRPHMRLHDGHCAALIIDLDARVFRCGMYAERPDVCRALERGSSSCKFEHDRKLDKPDVLVARLRKGRAGRPPQT